MSKDDLNYLICRLLCRYYPRGKASELEDGDYDECRKHSPCPAEIVLDALEADVRLEYLRRQAEAEEETSEREEESPAPEKHTPKRIEEWDHLPTLKEISHEYGSDDYRTKDGMKYIKCQMCPLYYDGDCTHGVVDCNSYYDAHSEISAAISKNLAGKEA